MSYNKGYFVGLGAAINVSLGFVPDTVRVHNASDRDVIFEWHRGKIMPFTSGGTNVLAAGDQIRGVTSRATARIRQVILASGTFAGGDAAGWLILREVVGTFQSENIIELVTSGTLGTDDATVTAVVEFGEKTDTAVGTVTANGINQYDGSDGLLSAGFTMGTSVCESGKLLMWEAWREDDLK